MTTPVPGHVDPSLVVDFDFYDVPGAADDPYRRWKELQRLTPIFWTPRNGGHWVITLASDIREALRDFGRFSSAGGTIPRSMAAPHPEPPVAMDPPDHTAYRQLLTPFFTPAAVARLEPQVRSLARDLIQGFVADGECEFVEAFADQLPVIVFMRLAGLPLADRGKLLHWASTRIHGADPAARVEAMANINAYVAALAAERRRAAADDMFSQLARAQVNGAPVSDAHLLALLRTVMLAGLDSVATSLAMMVLHLATHDDDRRRAHGALEDPDRLTSVRDELLRRYGVANVMRTAASSFEFGGVRFAAGDPVLVAVFMHNLDEDLTDRPMEVDFDRSGPANGNFGFGPHQCIGAHLARMETLVFLQEWLRMIPEFRIKPGRRAIGQAGMLVTLKSVPITWAQG